MLAYVDPPPDLSRAMSRVAAALKRHAPVKVDFVKREEDAEFVLIHVVGLAGLADMIARLRARNQQWAIIQYCYLTTEDSRPEAWVDIWREAKFVWSYYDLPGDGERYTTPLGIDPVFLNPPSLERRWEILTSGYVDVGGEAIGQCYVAAKNQGRRVFHLGPDQPEGLFKTHPSVWTSQLGISDTELSYVYSQCNHVSGLRWYEGFELPVVEGISCGARPICFDLPVYRRWFDGLARFVPHDAPTLVPALEDCFKNPMPVTSADIAEARQRFDWEVITTGFWERVE